MALEDSRYQPQRKEKPEAKEVGGKDWIHARHLREILPLGGLGANEPDPRKLQL
jgi:hypothetical protein